jgi:hypothetical protein
MPYFHTQPKFLMALSQPDNLGLDSIASIMASLKHFKVSP